MIQRTMNMDAARSSETLVSYITIWCHNPENLNLNGISLPANQVPAAQGRSHMMALLLALKLFIHGNDRKVKVNVVPMLNPLMNMNALISSVSNTLHGV
jgi:hypothetical protein